jgi:PPE-repeat protein
LAHPTELRWLERAAWLLDDAIRVPILNRRIGLDPLLGLLPGAGDTVAALMAATTLLSALKHGVPGITIARMGVNIALDYVIGLVPLLGDLGDFAFKANRRNLELLRRHALAQRKASPGDYLVVGGVGLGLGALFAAGIWLVVQGLRLVMP